MSHGPLLIALDIDGTLMTHDQVMTPRLAQVLAQLRAEGHHVVLASGRSVVAMLPVAKELGITTGQMVCSNGAVTVRLDEQEESGFHLEDQVTFDPEPALRLLRDQLPGARFAVEDVGLGFRLNELFPEGELHGQQRVVPFEALWAHEVTRVVVRSPEGSSEEFHELAHQLGLEDVTYSIGWTAWMDIAPLGVTKATALEQLRRQLHVQPHQTVAIGDGNNDIDMLRWAAHGLAMGQANAAVKAAADQVIDSIDDDGATKFLETLLPSGRDVG